jgi:hypothetical protein
MKILLDIPDNKAASLMDVLRSISYVKAETISPKKAQFLKELKVSVEEVILAKRGKVKLKSADQLLHEL